MKTLGALLLLAAAARGQENSSAEREKALMDRIAALEQRLRETEDQGEKERLRSELEGLRKQAARLREPRRGPESARMRGRIEELRARLRENPDDPKAAAELEELLRRPSEDRGGAWRGDPRSPERDRERPPGPPWRGPGPGPERRFHRGGDEDRTEGPPGPFDPEGVRAWLREAEPETHRHLMRLEEEGRPQEVQDLLRQAEGRRREMEELRGRDPAAFEKMREMRRLERESLEMGDRLRQSPPGPSREEGIRKLTELLNRLFDLREEARAREVSELKRRVEELEKSLSSRRAAKDRIVERRRRELLGERIDEDW